jgi:predicted PurR-regulated permease PerM
MTGWACVSKAIRTRRSGAEVSETKAPANQRTAAANGEAAAPMIHAVIAIAILALVVAGCALVLLPFATAILWAAILTFSTWALFRQLTAILGGRATLAALVMTLALASVIVAPFVAVGNGLAENVSAVTSVIRSGFEQGPREPPAWLSDIPVLGLHIHDYLNRLATDPAARTEAVRALVKPLREYALDLGKAIGHGLLDITLSLVVCFFLYRDGEAAAARLRNLAIQLAGARGEHLLTVAHDTVRGVVYGVIGTSLIQGALGGLGFLIAGVPGAPLLGFGTFLLAFVPMGPVLLWGPAAGWLYLQDQRAWAIFLAAWMVITGSLVDHVLKPYLIARNGGAPFLIVLFGVLGGALAFGFIGVFLGPTLLAVGYALLDEWSTQLAD